MHKIDFIWIFFHIPTTKCCCTRTIKLYLKSSDHPLSPTYLLVKHAHFVVELLNEVGSKCLCTASTESCTMCLYRFNMIYWQLYCFQWYKCICFVNSQLLGKYFDIICRYGPSNCMNQMKDEPSYVLRGVTDENDNKFYFSCPFPKLILQLDKNDICLKLKHII